MSDVRPPARVTTAQQILDRLAELEAVADARPPDPDRSIEAVQFIGRYPYRPRPCADGKPATDGGAS